MAARLMHGFKALAERTALSLRTELGLELLDRLDASKLAEHLGVKVLSLQDLAQFGARERSIAHLLDPKSGFSALTVCRGERRVIVHNSSHPPGRQANSLAHELAHIILEHEPTSNPFDSGCRVWDEKHEAEADWLGAALLVPRDGALRWLGAGRSVSSGAEHFGVSLALFNWRTNQTGVAYQLNARRRRSAAD